MEMYLHIVGAMLVIASSGLIANRLCCRANKIVKIIKNTANAYSCVAADIRTGHTSLPDAFLKVKEKSHDTVVKKYFEDMRFMMTENNKLTDIKTVVESCVDLNFSDMLTEKDLELLKEFGALPVHLDIVIQIDFIDELVLRMRDRAVEASKEMSLKCRTYNAVCICAGIMIIVVLI